MPDDRKPLPHDIQVEQELLGALLMFNNVHPLVSGIVRQEHFYEPLHQQIWQVCDSLIQMRKPATVTTVGAFLPKDVHVMGKPIKAYLAALVAASTTVVNAPDFARIVRDLADYRDIIALTEEMMSLRSTVDPAELATHAIAKLDEIATRSAPTGAPAVDMRAATMRAVDASAKAYQNDGKPQGLSYGLKALDDKTLGARAGHLIVIAGRPGMGKEMPVDTPILTPEGWRKIGDIRVGDFVFGQNGLPTMVRGVFPQGIKQAYRVYFRDGTSTECGRDHLWQVMPADGRRRGVPVVKSLSDLLAAGLSNPRGGRRGAKWKIPLCRPIFYPARSLPIDPYFLGVLIGDGCLRERSISFSNPDFDSDVRDRIFQKMPREMFYEHRSAGCPAWYLRGKSFQSVRAALRDLGLLVKSGEKFLPQQYLTASVEQRMALLYALMDTDGSASKKGGASFSTTSSLLAHDVASLVRSLGGVAIISVNRRGHHQKSDEFTVRVRTEWCPFLTARKVARWGISKGVSRYIWDIRPSRMVEQVCISVDAADGLYLANDYIVTHNTALALYMARAFAEQGLPVWFYSAEMGDIDLTTRMLADKMWRPNRRLTYWQIASGKYREDIFERIRNAALDLAELPIKIEQEPGLTMSQIGSRARQHKRRHGLKALFIDHLGLVKPSGRYAGNKVNETGEISMGAKALAKELDVPVFLLSQINRGVEGREDKRPTLSDLRNSGDIEQDADTVMILYREAYYLAKKEPPPGSAEFLLWANEMARVENVLDLYLEKQRGGPVGRVRLFCDIGCNVVRDEITEMDDSLMRPQDRAEDLV